MIDANLGSLLTSFFLPTNSSLLSKIYCENIIDVMLLFYRKSTIIRKNIKFIRIFVHRAPTKDESIQIITLSKYEKLQAFG